MSQSRHVTHHGLLASGFLLLFCPSAPAGDLRSDLERRVALEVEATRRIASAEDHYRQGRLLERAGRREEAAAEFRKADDVILDAGEEAYFETALRAYLHKLRARLIRPNSNGVKAGENGLASLPEISIDARLLAWLTSALKRPIPEEAQLRADFRIRGVPEELIYLGLVESGFQSGAISPAGAAGPWQFMPETARRYGLRQDRRVDERHDLLKSARAAAEYLRDLYKLLGDWTLAIAAYNAGEYRVLRAVTKSGTTDFWRLRHLLPAETAAYVPRVLAAIRLARGLS